MLSKYGNCTLLLKIKNKLKIDCFTNKVGKNSQYFVRVFNKTIIPLALVGCEKALTDITRKNHDLNKSTTQKILAKFSYPN